MIRSQLSKQSMLLFGSLLVFFLDFAPLWAKGFEFSPRLKPRAYLHLDTRGMPPEHVLRTLQLEDFISSEMPGTYSDEEHWFLLELTSQGEKEQFFALSSTMISACELWLVGEQGALQKMAPIERTRYPSFHLPDMKVGQQLLVRVYFPDAVETGFVLTDLSSEDLQDEQLKSLLNFLIMGLAIGSFLSHLIFALSHRQRRYAYFACYAFILLLISSLFAGNPFVFGLPRKLAELSSILGCLGTIFIVYFFTDVLQVRSFAPKRKRVLDGMSLLCWGFAFCLAFGGTRLVQYGVDVCMTGGTMILISLAIQRSLKNDSLGRNFLLAWTMLLASYLAFLAVTYGYIPKTIWTDSFVLLGTVVHLFILSRGLSEEMNQKREHLLEELRQAKDSLQQSLEKLEHEISSRASLVADLAHRGNNPLHAADLALDYLQVEVPVMAKTVESLFGPRETWDSETREVAETIHHSFQALILMVNTSRAGITRMTEAIRDIRLMSGVDGLALDWTHLHFLLHDLQQRLKESLGDERAAQLVWSGEVASCPRLLAQQRFLGICLERFFRRLLTLHPKSHEIAVSFALITPERLRIRFQCRGTEVTAELKDLCANLNYLLDWQGIQVQFGGDTLILGVRLSALESLPVMTTDLRKAG